MSSIGGLLLLACLAMNSGCASAVVVPRREGVRSAAQVLRLATERGVKDVSTGEWRILEVPIEVRTDSLPVPLPGCALRGFRTSDLDRGEFSIHELVEDDSVELSAVVAEAPPRGILRRPPPPDSAAADSTARGVAPVAGLRATLPQAMHQVTVVIPPFSHQIVTLTVRVRRSALDGRELGLRLDSSPPALGAVESCPSPITGQDPAHVEHYLLPGVLVETGGVAIAATALMLGVIILLTGR